MSMSTISAPDNQRVITPQTTTILFDHDGTLIDSETIHFDLWCDILDDFGVTLTQDFYCKVMAGIPVKQNAVDLVEHFNLDVSPSYLAQRKHECLEPVYLCSFFVLAVKIVHHKALLVQFGDPNKPVTTK